jgi:ribonuclease-3 family protein
MDEMNLKNYAYLGDAVWELFVREKTIFQTQNAEKLHKITTEKVKAKAQHDFLIQIQDKLSEDELEIMRRSRNLPVPIARKSNQSEYRMATAFEALIGWWYLNDKERLNEMEKLLLGIL